MKPFGMPDQPGSGVGSVSCVVAVLMAARSFFIGERTLDRNYADMDYYRMKFMLEIVRDGLQ